MREFMIIMSFVIVVLASVSCGFAYGRGEGIKAIRKEYDPLIQEAREEAAKANKMLDEVERIRKKADEYLRLARRGN